MLKQGCVWLDVCGFCVCVCVYARLHVLGCVCVYLLEKLDNSSVFFCGWVERELKWLHAGLNNYDALYISL